MEAFFGEYKILIIFLHVLSAVVWVGGMIAIRYAAHASFMQIESPSRRMERILHALKRLFSIVTPFVILLFVTAFIMIKGYALSSSEYATLTHAKEAIWGVMAVNLFVMILRRNRAQKLLDMGDMMGAKFSLRLIGTFMVPVNIILGISAIFLGAFLSTHL